MPSNHLILCCPLLPLPSNFPASRSTSINWLFASGNQSIGASDSVLPVNIQDWFPLALTCYIPFAVKGTLKSLLQQHNWKVAVPQHSAFCTVQHSYPYIMTIWKTIALTIWTFVSKVMFLLFNTLSRFVIAFLPRGKSLVISRLQSLSAVILEPRNIKSVTVDIVTPHICHEGMGPDTMILVFWMLRFKPDFSHSSFTFIKRLFSSSLLSAIRVVSSAYLRLLMFLLAILIPLVLHPAQHFTWCTLHIS